MSRYNGEKILVVPRDLFEKTGYFSGVNQQPELYLEAFLAPGAAFFTDREAAEQNPAYKQLISYAIFTYQGKILHYTRGGSGGEARLHDKGSIGIGGHINPVDEQGTTQGRETYMAGVYREVGEELNIDGDVVQKVIGLINDDSNEVGAVHLGVIHQFELSSDHVSSNESSLQNLTFYSLDELVDQRFENLETWSQLCVQALRSSML